MDYQKTLAEAKMAKKLHELTGKKMDTCYFCLRYSKGNFRKAFNLCNRKKDDTEGDRRKAA